MIQTPFSETDKTVDKQHIMSVIVDWFETVQYQMFIIIKISSITINNIEKGI